MYPSTMVDHGTRFRAAAAAAFLLGAASIAAADSLFSGNERIRIETEATLKAGIASIEVRCPTRAARVYIDSGYVGSAPYSSDLAAGIHYLRVEARGCHPLGIELPLAEKTLYKITFDPARVTGTLFVGLEPPSATLTLDGESIDPGFNEVPVGTYTLVARRFGYREERRSVEVFEDSTTSVRFSLEAAAFEVTGFRATRGAFNPANAGASGRTELAFQATNYGSARIEILGPDGSVVRAIDFPRIAAWSQIGAWDGRGEDGHPLPDGTYVARLGASPGPGVPTLAEGDLGVGSEGKVAPDGSIEMETEIRIDSSILVRATGANSAMPGLLAFPDPVPQPAGSTAIEAAWFAPGADVSSSAVGLSLSTSIAGAAAISLSGAAELGERGSADLAASVLVSLLADRASGSGGAVLVRASYASASDPSMPESRSAVEASIPWSLAFGRIKAGLAPGMLLDFGSGTEFLALARAGLWLDSGPLRAGLSGMMSFALGLGDSEAGPSWPARVAAEARLMLGSSPFTLSAYALADIYPDSEPRILAGLGVGLLF
jgi:hypothetical protein